MNKLLILFFSIFVSTSFAQTWQNPFTNPDELGDPYIMKDKGTYYLFASNGDEQILRCNVSTGKCFGYFTHRDSRSHRCSQSMKGDQQHNHKRFACLGRYFSFNRRY